MLEYIKTNKPSTSLKLILILLISMIITQLSGTVRELVILYPSHLKEPWNWYRLITYPLYVNGLKSWIHSSLVIVLTGYIIERRIKTADVVQIIIISTILGGLIFIILNQEQEFEQAIATPTMITWGYLSAAVVIGVKYWRTLVLFERIVLILCFLSLLNITSDNFGFLFGQLSAITVITIFTIFKTTKKTGHNNG